VFLRARRSTRLRDDGSEAGLREFSAGSDARITEAAVDLHGTIGPARTTISAVAERAGVERLTVYRHFPDEHALFQACTSHWLERNPFPDPSLWEGLADPEARLRQALRELYAWYRRTEQMMSNFFRDGPSVPALAGRQEEWASYLEQARRVLAQGWGLRGRRRVVLLAVLSHALNFHTWRSLSDQISDETAAELMVHLAQTAKTVAKKAPRRATRVPGSPQPTG
jgi:AcrR family transcriptional regulator